MKGTLSRADPHARSHPHRRTRPALQDGCTQEGELLAWIVTGTEGEIVARPVTAGRGALGYVLMAATLDALRAMLPAGLVRVPAMPVHPAGMVELWHSREP